MRGSLAGPIGHRDKVSGCVVERGRGRLPIRLALALGVAALFAHSTATAQAAAPNLISYGTFSTDGALGVAVDQSNDDVFTAGFFADNANGEPTGLGFDQRFDAAGTPISSPFGRGGHYGLAVNPVNGHLYIANAFTNEIEVDEADGTPVSSSPPFTVPEFGALGVVAPAEIAADSEGHVYVPSAPNGEVIEYSESGTPLHTFAGLDEPTGVTVDGAGNLWVADRGAGRIEELSATGKVEDDIASDGVTGVALNAHGNVFALVSNSSDFCGSLAPPCEHLVEYSPAGTQLADIGAGDFGSATGAAPLFDMLAVNQSSGRVYVADDDGQNLVWIFGPPSAPSVARELSLEVGASEAKLGALVAAGGIETTFRFEYDTREYHASEGPHGVSVPFPEGSVGQSLAPRTVWAAASGLTPQTTYHYRVVATNALGTVAGPDRTFTTGAQATCPNEQMRSGFSANLPECRAYELVTPANAASAEESEKALAARSGDRISYTTEGVLPGSQSAGYTYVASRGNSGWSSEGVIPLQSYTAQCSEVAAGMVAQSPDLSQSVLFVGLQGNTSLGENGVGACDAEGLEVVPGEPIGYENLLLRDNATGTYRLIDVTPPGVRPANAQFRGASPDLSHVVFSESAQLTGNAPSDVENLYEWREGALYLITVLPNGDATSGALASNEEPAHAVSADGSHVFFTAGGKLYVRLNGERTVQVDEPREGGAGPGGGGNFRDASADGSHVFFTDEASAGLTNDTVAGSGENLYLYDVETGRLADLTPDSHVAVRGVVGIGEDGSSVYFLTNGALPAGGVEGQSNLYMWHDGTTTFIATMNFADGQEIVQGHARVSPNGGYLAFQSRDSLTGYDNNEEPEIFLYDAAADELACASCNPSAEAAVYGVEELKPEGTEREGAPHYVTNGGQVFFDTREELLPRDTNGKADVYEYANGQLQLISTGTGSAGAYFLDASESGEDVFFETRETLIPQATDEEARSIYDARVGGGFPELSVSQPCAEVETCHSAPTTQPALYGAPASQTFAGVGNLTPPATVTHKAKKRAKSKGTACRKGFVKRRGKCVKRAKRHRKHVTRSTRRNGKAGR